MWAFYELGCFLARIRPYIESLANVTHDIWFVGPTLGRLFDILAVEIGAVELYFFRVYLWSEDLEDRLTDVFSWDAIRAKIEDYFPLVRFNLGDILDLTWEYFITKLEYFLEDHLDWVWKVGEKVLNKLW